MNFRLGRRKRRKFSGRHDLDGLHFAVVRHIVLNILKMMDDKMSVARRIRHCSYDDAYLEKVIAKMLESV